MKKPPTINDVTLPEGEGIYTFSNGSEWEWWASTNCYACRWFDAESAGASCAFECAAFLGKVSPELAALFGWLRDAEDAEKYGERSAWDAPERCAFWKDKDERDDDRPAPPPIDPRQLTFLTPDGFPDVVTEPPLVLVAATPTDPPALTGDEET